MVVDHDVVAVGLGCRLTTVECGTLTRSRARLQGGRRLDLQPQAWCLAVLDLPLRTSLISREFEKKTLYCITVMQKFTTLSGHLYVQACPRLSTPTRPCEPGAADQWSNARNQPTAAVFIGILNSSPQRKPTQRALGTCSAHSRHSCAIDGEAAPPAPPPPVPPPPRRW